LRRRRRKFSLKNNVQQKPVKRLHLFRGILMNVFRASLLTPLPLLLGGTAPDHASVLEVGSDQIVASTVAGTPARLKVMASAPGTLFLNPDIAQNLKLKSGPFKGIAKIGPVSVKVNSAVSRFGILSAEAKRRVLWSDRDFAPGADGGIGPGGVPQQTIVFHLRPATPGETEFTLPLFEASSGYGALETRASVAGRTIGIGFDLTRRNTLSTAAAAGALSTNNGGQLSGATKQEVIRLGVARPVRRFVLNRPLSIGPLRLSEMLARVQDNSDGSSIDDSDGDLSEIVVTAKSKQKPIYSILIGSDALSSCSVLVFDKGRKVIRLRCRRP